MSEIKLKEQLLKRCRSNDQAAFGSLINLYRKQLFSYLLRLSGNKMLAEDLFQETLIKVWKGLNKYNEQNKFSSWLFSIAHNVAVDSARSKEVRNKHMSSSDNYTYQSSSNPHSDFVETETREILMSAVDTLPEKQKEVFLLRLHSGMQFKEIAEITKQPLNTVLGHMHYAVSKIREKVNRAYEE
ncbi:MAG: sigma-70 family RNA polymerase sigma factor [Ignavibacterium sp.]|nr:MAG: sigma-70 family RNA polymerase sigma factor [Ignavibacterium sp.]